MGDCDYDYILNNASQQFRRINVPTKPFQTPSLRRIVWPRERALARSIKTFSNEIKLRWVTHYISLCQLNNLCGKWKCMARNHWLSNQWPQMKWTLKWCQRRKNEKFIDKTYPCECTCASSCPIFDGIVYHSIGMDTVVCRCELADVSTTYSIS